MRHGTGLWGNVKIKSTSNDSLGNSGSYIVFEKVLSDNENDIEIGTDLQSTFLVFRNGRLTSEWSGVGTSTLHLTSPGMQYDQIVVVSIFLGYFEKTLAENETVVDVGFTIRSSSMVFFNGRILMTSQWSGSGSMNITLLFPVAQYDKLVFINR